ncbi:MAG: glucuronate isomerase [Deltaproteobacteria bacterium]|nr:glucuronate isomerase [Deltaproteobacteria bacterium]
MKNFMTDDFLLQTETAKTLYHRHAASMPIFDYHCHLSPQQIADDIQFENITQAWLYGDHYKWRAMRTNGINEEFITGNASDWEKFQKWAETVPYTLRNPLYHWTHLELRRYFGVEELLNPDTAKPIYEKCSEMISSPEYSTRNMMRKMNVKAVCTTDDPVDTLQHHKKIKDDGSEIKVLPTWRPDKGMATENIETLNSWINKLSKVAEIDIKNFDNYITAIKKRHDFFHEMGCRISDHGIETAYAEDYSTTEIQGIFDKIRSGKEPSCDEQLKFKSAMLVEFALMDHAKGWTQQFHLGALRNNCSRMLRTLGPDTGFDSIVDIEIAKPLAKFLDRLDIDNQLPKTIIYNLNPSDNELIATMIGNFQDGSVPGKVQFGSGWWFLDQKDGMEKQIEVLSNLGLLSRFVGMLTDSRSFLSYPRHEYFRRILCNILGNDVENGMLPNDMTLLGEMVENISFKNANEYFSIDLNSI